MSKIECDFRKKNYARSDVEKYLLSTDECKEAIARLLALGVNDPVEFLVPRENYYFDVFIQSTNFVLETHYSLDYIFKIRLVVDIKLFDTQDKIYLPGGLDEIEVVGNTRDTKFENQLIGGLFITDSQTIIIERYAFSGLTIKESAMCVTLTDTSGHKFDIADLYQNCNLMKVRHIYSYNKYFDFKSNGNTISKINNMHIELNMRDCLNAADLSDIVQNIGEVEVWHFSVMFIDKNISDFKLDDYVNKISRLSKSFIRLNLSGRQIVTYIPGMFGLFKFNENKLNILRQRLTTFNTKSIEFGLYI